MAHVNRIECDMCPATIPINEYHKGGSNVENAWSKTTIVVTIEETYEGEGTRTSEMEYDCCPKCTKDIKTFLKSKLFVHQY